MLKDLKEKEQKQADRGRLVTYNHSKTKFYYVEPEGDFFTLYDSDDEKLHTGKHQDCIVMKYNLLKS